ncbi:YnbE family lipoprotein, partial [Brevundimonas vesicularis]
MIHKRQLAGLGFGAVVVALAACAPTIRLEVAPIQIYAKLDADVRVRL